MVSNYFANEQRQRSLQRALVSTPTWLDPETWELFMIIANFSSGMVANLKIYD